MSLSPFRNGLLIFCIMGLLAPAAAAAGRAEFVTGSDRALWLVRTRDTDPPTFTIVAKRIDRDWQWQVRETIGAVVATLGASDVLHVFLEGGGYLLFPLADVDMAMPGPSLHAAPRAVCAAPPGFLDTDALSILAITPRLGEPATAPSTAAATQPPTTSQPDTARLAVYRREGNRWKRLCALEGIRIEAGDKLLAAADTRALSVFVERASAEPDRNELWQYADNAWKRVPLQGPAQTGRAIGAFVLESKLRLLITTPMSQPPTEASSWRLSIVTVQPGGVLSDQPVTTQADERAEWSPAELPLHAARLGDRVALLWKEDGARRMATCGMDGRMFAPTPTTLPAAKESNQQGQKLYEYFMWTVLTAVFVLMFVLRPRTESLPFVLPEQQRPGSVVRRILAFLIDFLPFYAAGLYAFAPELLTQPAGSFEELRQTAKQLAGSSRLAYATITLTGAYTVYATGMELRFGATLGKMTVKLRVVGPEGRAADARGIILRNLVRILELYPLLLPLAGLFVLLTRYHQRPGDFFARTIVIDSTTRQPGPGDEEADQQDRPPEQDEPPTRESR